VSVPHDPLLVELLGLLPREGQLVPIRDGPLQPLFQVQILSWMSFRRFRRRLSRLRL